MSRKEANKKNKLQASTVITAHANADFDALAAIIAASRLYDDAVLIFPGSQEKNLRNFYIQSTTYLFNFKKFSEIDPDAVKLLVVVDTRQKSRLDHVGPLIDKPGVEVHVYDHHPDSEEDLDADQSVVLPWGSTATILTLRMKERNVLPTSEEATILGLGIFEDTGSFNFDSTTEHDFAAAAWLRKHGMELGVIQDLLQRDLSSEQVGILGELLKAATTHAIHGVEVVITEVSTEHFIGDFAFLVHKFIDMENLRVLFALGRMGDRIHLVARSRTPDVNVGQICSTFGGGGHAYAASATIKDKTLAEVRDDLFGLLYSQINPQMMVADFMSQPTMHIQDDTSMAEAVELMKNFGLKGVPVVAAGSLRCVGILENKLADKAVSHGLGKWKVSEYMMGKFSAVSPGDDLYGVMEIILGKRQRMVPVVQDDELKGVITRTDLVNILVEEPSRIPESLLPERKRKRNVKSLMRNRLPKEAYQLLEKAGYLAQSMNLVVYAVGGFVRDILLSRPNLDIDLVVEGGNGIEFARALADRLGGRVKAHRKFKTAVVILPDGQRVDVATARLEYYQQPAALPTVELSSIKMDLYRRDFTINAVAVHLNPGNMGELVDFFGAQKDIKDKLVRVLHSLSFVEDPTRILRAVRFEQRFGFRIGGQTLRLIKNALQLKMFNRLSGSRIFHELQLIMAEEDPLSCFTRMDELGLLEAIHPDLVLNSNKIKQLMELEKVHNWYKLLFLEPSCEPWKLFFLGLTLGLDRKKASNIIKRLNLSKRDERDFLGLRETVGEAQGKLMNWLQNDRPLSELCALLDPLPIEGTLFLMARSQKEQTRKKISQVIVTYRFVKPDVTGEDLKDIGVQVGPSFGIILDKLRSAKIDGKAPDRESQLKLAEVLARTTHSAGRPAKAASAENSGGQGKRKTRGDRKRARSAQKDRTPPSTGDEKTDNTNTSSENSGEDG